MDSLGARHLAMRISAGVRIGTVIELQQDVISEGLRAGDRGVVWDISLEGVHVQWERGFSRVIHPDRSLYRLAS